MATGPVSSVAFDSELTARAEVVAAALRKRGQTIAVVECSLGGALGHLLTNLPGSSAWFVASVTPYSAHAKDTLLGTSPDAFGIEGAVSASGASLMATAIRSRTNADWGFAESGILGPRGAHRSVKSPGIDFVCIVGPDKIQRFASVDTGHDDRVTNKRAFLVAALSVIQDAVEASV